jgi:hypothetical protein
LLRAFVPRNPLERDRYLYAVLERIDPTPLYTMNRAIAVGEWQAPEPSLQPQNELRGWRSPHDVTGSPIAERVTGRGSSRVDRIPIVETSHA